MLGESRDGGFVVVSIVLTKVCGIFQLLLAFGPLAYLILECLSDFGEIPIKMNILKRES
jgi:hypothetical protein